MGRRLLALASDSGFTFMSRPPRASIEAFD